MIMNIAIFVGVAASICTTLSFLPQLIKMIRTKKTGDISYFMLIILFVGGGLWIGYGIIKDDWIIIISNSVSTLINIVSGIFSIKYRPRDKTLSDLA